MARGTESGICRLCHEEKELTFEHVPPRSAFNRKTTYQKASFQEIIGLNNPLNDKIKGRIQQGGIGVNAYCADCNNFLGRKYVASYKKWANSGKFALAQGNYAYCEYEVDKILPNEILKHVISMFLAINEPWYGKSYNELREFVLNPSSTELNSKYRIFTYLKKTGQIRYLPFIISPSQKSGEPISCSEIAFSPFGFVITFDNQEEHPELLEITEFKNISPKSERKIDLKIRVHETHLPFPLDYRTKEEIEKGLKTTGNKK